MAKGREVTIADILKQQEAGLGDAWIDAMRKSGAMRQDLIRESEVKEQCSDLLRQLSQAAGAGVPIDGQAPEWRPVFGFLENISASRARQGFTPSQVATFVFSLKQPLFDAVQKESGADTALVADLLWEATLLIDKLGLWTVESYQVAREEVIQRQQEELLELSTPVVKLWEGVLALPIIGTLDSRRTQTVMENLLNAIVTTGADVAIIDITGVPTVDTVVSQHLLKTVAAAQLMGAECIISGIRPQIAQTIVHLGVDLGMVTTRATLADALRLALTRVGSTITTKRIAA